jgi:hypothetical protein
VCVAHHVDESVAMGIVAHPGPKLLAAHRGQRVH